VIRSKSYLYNCYRYIYQNPLRAKISQRVEDYPFSTIHYIHRGIPFVIPLFDQFGFKDKYMLDWLNVPMDEVEKEKVKKGLRRFIEPSKKN
jgi:putative transposase